MTSEQFITPEARYAAVVEVLLSNPDVTPPAAIPSSQKFGTSAELRVHNKIFAMLRKGQLVLKLPQQRVNALIAAGSGVRFDTGNRRLMKEWVCIEPAAPEEWLALANEALAFVAAKR